MRFLSSYIRNNLSKYRCAQFCTSPITPGTISFEMANGVNLNRRSRRRSVERGDLHHGSPDDVAASSPRGHLTYRHAPGDPEIRAALLERLYRHHDDERDVVFIEELGLCRGQVFVDVTVVNGILHGYEIKSDRDNLRRLIGQSSLYGGVLDRATLVVGPRHAAAAVAAVPSWWGILIAESADGEIHFQQVRNGQLNPSRDPRALVELLWLDRALELLAARNAIRGYRGKRRHEVWKRVCELYDLDEVAEAVRTLLKARRARQSVVQCA